MEEEHRLRNEKETQLTDLQERYIMESYPHHTRVLTSLPTPHPDIRAHITNAPLYRYRTLYRYTQSVEAELLHLLYQWLPQVRAIPAPRRAAPRTPRHVPPLFASPPRAARAATKALRPHP